MTGPEDGPLEGRAARAIEVLSEAFQSHAQLSAPMEDANVAQVAVSWTIRVLRTAEAVAALHRAELSDTASPMVRSVMEHAISLLWLVERREEAVNAIEFGHRRHQRLLRDSAQQGGWNPSEIDPAVATAPLDLAMVQPEDWPKLKNFEQRSADPVVRGWYVTYRIESGLSHASYLSGAVYVADDGFHWEPVVPSTPLRATAVFAVMTVQTLKELLDPSPGLAAAVDEAVSLIGLATPTE